MTSGRRERLTAVGAAIAEWLQAQIVRLAPVDIEACAAAIAAHRPGVSIDRLAFAATGAHGVAVAPARRQADGVLRARHDGPADRWGLDDLKNRGGGPAGLSPHTKHAPRAAPLHVPIPTSP